jgi:hypothetical protein
LFSYLLDDLVVSDNDYCHPAELRVFRPSDDERIDIERPCREHTRNVGQNSRFILD